MIVKVENIFDSLRDIESYFMEHYQVDDIYSNSKIYEILIANQFDHRIIPGHSGSRDAKDLNGNEVEYKHYKESSSNHTWTFNDFSDTTIEKLKITPWVYFVYIDDVNYKFPGKIIWYYKVVGRDISDFLALKTPFITNTRKMINVSCNNLESIGYSKIFATDFVISNGYYGEKLSEIIKYAEELEICTNTKGLLTSNKIWELLVACRLGHKINSEQGGREGAHDAYDEDGHLFEYKVSKTCSWNFQDISDNVLNKYLNDTLIILAVVDKTNLSVKEVYAAEPKYVVPILSEKLASKIKNCESKGKKIRRLQVSLCKTDLKKINAKQIL